MYSTLDVTRLPPKHSCPKFIIAVEPCLIQSSSSVKHVILSFDWFDLGRVCAILESSLCVLLQELRHLMLQYGGVFENYFRRDLVTHIICSTLPDSKIKNPRCVTIHNDTASLSSSDWNLASICTCDVF